MKALSRQGRLGQAAVIAVLAVVACLAAYPFVNALAFSLSDPIEASRGGIYLLPRKVTFQNYEAAFRRRDVLPAFAISVARTLAGITYHLFFCGIASYALSKEALPFNRTLTVFLIVPMYVFPGLIPAYVNIYELGLMNSFWVYVLPHAFGAYNMLVMRTYFRGIPESLSESAHIDGAGQWRILFTVIVPLSAPVLAVMALWQGVWQWNSWFDAMLYVANVKLHPVAMLLRRIISENEIAETTSLDAAMGGQGRTFSPKSLQMTMLLITTLPIVLVYPFLQRYFVKGIMIGAVKG